MSLDTSLGMARCKHETYSLYLWQDCLHCTCRYPANNLSCNYDISGMLTHFQAFELDTHRPSAANCIYLCTPHTLHMWQNVFFSLLFSLWFMLSNVTTSLLGKLKATLKKYQDRDILNLIRSQANIKNELLTQFRDISQVCHRAPFFVISGLN